MADDTKPSLDQALVELQAYVAAVGVDEAAVKMANALDERFVAALGLTPFAHGILALIGQQLGQAGVAPDAILAPLPVAENAALAAGGLAVPLLAAYLQHHAGSGAWVCRYLAFQAGWWRR